MTDASKPLFTIEDSLSALEYAAEGRVNSVKPDLLANYINRKIAARDADLVRDAVDSEEKNPWKLAVIEALICWHIYSDKDLADAKAALNKLLAYEIKVALDPAVSSEAAELIRENLDPTYRERIEAQAQAEAFMSCIRECDRHALFLKHEMEHGGDYEHLKTRKDEAEYLAGRMRAELERLKPVEGK